MNTEDITKVDIQDIRAKLRKFWKFVERHNAVVEQKADGLYILPDGCNIDAFLKEYTGTYAVMVKDGKIYINVLSLCYPATLDEIIEAGKDMVDLPFAKVHES